MAFLKAKPKRIFGKKVSSIVPLILNVVALFFFIAATASSVYEDGSKKYSMWKYWNKTSSGGEEELWFEAEMAPCEEHHFYLKVGAIYHITTIVFSVVTIIANLLDFFDRPFVSKAHGILSVTTVFMAAISFTITISLMSNGVCDLAPVKYAGMEYGAAQPLQVVGCIVTILASFFTYAF